MRTSPALIALALLTGACSAPSEQPAADATTPASDYRVVTSQTREHGLDDDLLTGGLGRTGLLGEAPVLDSVDNSQQLRQLAIYHGWHAVAQLRGPRGTLELLPQLKPVPGREVSALLQLASRQHPFRVVVQLPAGSSGECLVVTPSSGSRGVFGAIALAGPWALQRGCAVVYTDKGAGSDVAFADDQSSVRLDGTRAALDTPQLAFPAQFGESGQVAVKHAHSGDHPEADWGRHTLAAADFALKQMQRSPEQTRVIALGLSNGGGAVLRAAELDSTGLLDGVVALSPNVTAPNQPPLYDYATLAALLQPCLMADTTAIAEMTLGNPALVGMGMQRCQALQAAGLLDEASPQAARQQLEAIGFDQAALSQSAVNSLTDVWRMVAVTYASSYLQSRSGNMPCGYRFAIGEMSETERSSLWARFSGVAPGNGIALNDGQATDTGSALPGLQCLRSLWTGDQANADALRANVEQVIASAQLPEIPVLIMHGREDGLIPLALSAGPYAEQANANGARLSLQTITPAQHFDTLLAAPGVSSEFIPLLPYAWQGLDHLQQVLDGDQPLLASGTITARPPTDGESLTLGHLNWPR